MKNFLPVVLIAASILMCCSCAESSVLENPSSSSSSLENPSESGVSQDTVSEKSIKEIYLERKEAAAEDWEKRNKSEMQTFTNESDGVILTVMTDKHEYTAGEPVKIKSTAQNITDGEICNKYSYLGDCYPVEFLVDFTNGKKLYSERYYKEVMSCANIYVPMKPGEVYDDYMTLETHYYNSEPAEPGVYNGTCYIYTVPNEHDYNKTTKHSVDFSITLK